MNCNQCIEDIKDNSALYKLILDEIKNNNGIFIEINKDNIEFN